MDYRVEPTRVSGRSTVPAVVVVGGLVAFLATAVLVANGFSTSPVPKLGVNASAQSPAALELSGVPSPTAPFRFDTMEPEAVEGPGRVVNPDAASCHDLARRPCLELADAAATAVRRSIGSNEPTMRIVDVSATLVCNSDTDCPRELPRQLNPRGSVVVSVDGSPVTAWVNVGEVPVPGIDLHAWVIRWSAPSSCWRASTGCDAPGAGDTSSGRFLTLTTRTQSIGR